MRLNARSCLPLELLALADVEPQRHGARHRALGVPQGRRGEADVDVRSIFPSTADFHVQKLRPGQRALEDRVGFGQPVVRNEWWIIPQYLVRGPAEHAFGCRIPDRQPAVEAMRPHRDRRALHDRPEHFAALVRQLLDLPATCDVADDACEERSSSRGPPFDRELRGKLSAVDLHPGQRDRLDARRPKSLGSMAAGLAVPVGDEDQAGQRGAQHFDAWIAEHRLGGAVRDDDGPRVVRDQNRVGRGLCHGAKALFAFRELTPTLSIGGGQERGQPGDDVEQDEIEDRDRPHADRDRGRCRRIRVLQERGNEEARRRESGGEETGAARQHEGDVDRGDHVDTEVRRGEDTAGPIQSERDEQDVQDQADIGLETDLPTDPDCHIIRNIESERRQRGDADQRSSVIALVEDEHQQGDRRADQNLLAEAPPACPRDRGQTVSHSSH